MTDLSARLRELLRDETLAKIDKAAELERLLSRQRDRGGDRLSAIHLWRWELEKVLLPLLSSLQEEREREIAAYVRSNGAAYTRAMRKTIAKNIESGKWRLASSSSPAAPPQEK